MNFKSLSEISNRILPYSLIALSFTIPIDYRIAIYFIFLSVLLWMLSGITIKDLKKLFLVKPFILLILFWFLYAISIAYSTNISRGFSDITQKISFLIFPLIFATRNDTLKKSEGAILNAFLLGLITIGIFLIARAFYNSITVTSDGLLFNIHPVDVFWEDYFHYSRFTEPNHPTYLSMFYSLGIGLIAYKYRKESSKLMRILYAFVVVFFLLMVYLASSKAGILTGLLTGVISLFWVLKRRGRLVSAISVAIAIGILIFFMGKNNRISSFIEYFNTDPKVELRQDEKELEQKLRNDGTIRFGIWKNIPKIVGSRWLFGVGTGDVKQELMEGYKNYNVFYAYEMRLNTHNQFLETFVGVGIVGLTILLVLLGLSFRYAIVNKNMLLFIFLLIISFNFLFESVFERLFGVVFFAFFFSLFIMKKEYR